MIHDEADRARASRHDDDGVHIADVIAHQHRRPFRGDAFTIDDFDAVHGLDEYPRQETHEKFRHQRKDVGRHQRVQDGRDEEQLRDRKPLAQQHDGHAGRRHHEQGVQDIHAGDRA